MSSITSGIRAVGVGGVARRIRHPVHAYGHKRRYGKIQALEIGLDIAHDVARRRIPAGRSSALWQWRGGKVIQLGNFGRGQRSGGRRRPSVAPARAIRGYPNRNALHNPVAARWEYAAIPRGPR